MRSTARVSGREVGFSTAWSEPTRVLHRLSKKFPNEIITVKHALETHWAPEVSYYTLKDGADEDLDIDSNVTVWSYRVAHPLDTRSQSEILDEYRDLLDTE